MIDIITHGSPCQDFSVAGKGAGGEEGSGTRSSLMHTTVDIAAEVMPKYVVWENVKNVLSAKHRGAFDAYLETLRDLGYNNYWKVLNAKHYGVPQNRERIFCISIRCDIDQYGGMDGNFPWPEPFDNGVRLKHMLEQNVDEKYYLSEEKTAKLVMQLKGEGGMAIKEATYPDDRGVLEPSGLYTGVSEDFFGQPTLGYSRCLKANKSDAGLIEPNECIQAADLNHCGNDQMNRVYSPDGVSPTITVVTGGGREQKVMQNFRIRKLTPLECWRLMGQPDENFYKAQAAGISASQLYKQAGNSIVVDVLYHIFKNMFEPGTKLTLLDLFAGIGAFHSGLERAGVEVDLFAYCEIDKYASKSYSAIHGVSESENFWDVTKVLPDGLLYKHLT